MGDRWQWGKKKTKENQQRAVAVPAGGIDRCRWDTVSYIDGSREAGSFSGVGRHLPPDSTFKPRERSTELA